MARMTTCMNLLFPSLVHPVCIGPSCTVSPRGHEVHPENGSSAQPLEPLSQSADSVDQGIPFNPLHPPLLPDPLEFFVSLSSPLFQDSAELTPLHWAAFKGHTDQVRLLLPHTPVDLVDSGGLTAFERAAFSGHSDCVALFISHFQTHGLSADFDRALHYAVRSQNAECVRLLLPRANPLQTDRNGRTALHVAARKGQTRALALLLVDFNPNTLDIFGWSPLHLAVLYGSAACVALLLPVTDLNLPSPHTALQLAELHHQNDCAALIAGFILSQSDQNQLELELFFQQHASHGDHPYPASSESRRMRVLSPSAGCQQTL